MIDPNQLEDIFKDSLCKNKEEIPDPIKIEGITTNVWFHPERLQGHRAEIESMLGELPDPFKASIGGGWSFLQADTDKQGNQWTGFHKRIEELFLLGMGIGKVECLAPRAMWSVLPGGMPYYCVHDK